MNVLLCSNFPAKKNTGASTKTMRRNCLKHFAATIQILEPTLMVLHGEGVQDWIAPVLGLMDERARTWPRCSSRATACSCVASPTPRPEGASAGEIGLTLRTFERSWNPRFASRSPSCRRYASDAELRDRDRPSIRDATEGCCR